MPLNDDDILIGWKIGTDTLQDIRIRINHYNIDLVFVEWVADFARKRDLKLMTKSEVLIEPEVGVIMTELEKSKI